MRARLVEPCITMARERAGGRANRAARPDASGACRRAAAPSRCGFRAGRMPCLTGWTHPRGFCYLHMSLTRAAAPAPNIRGGF
ncbi:hypothetical protein MAFF301069_21270 [Ralstonia pseudosolanacearum]|nr:hypothetical protein MAFF301069_21270 [Ralstonia pseudosolanacearum]